MDTHGGTWHPRLPAFFKDPRKRLTEALLNRDKKAIDDVRVPAYPPPGLTIGLER